MKTLTEIFDDLEKARLSFERGDERSDTFINYAQTIWLLIKEIKELQVRLKSLEADVDVIHGNTR
jgi:phage host-nuclease inhibitor protein Gam